MEYIKLFFLLGLLLIKNKGFKPICRHMVCKMSTAKELKIIRDEIKELRLLYKNLVDKAIPIEEPSKSDKSAIRKKEKIVKESSLMKALD